MTGMMRMAFPTLAALSLAFAAVDMAPARAADGSKKCESAVTGYAATKILVKRLKASRRAGGDAERLSAAETDALRAELPIALELSSEPGLVKMKPRNGATLIVSRNHIRTDCPLPVGLMPQANKGGIAGPNIGASRGYGSE